MVVKKIFSLKVLLWIIVAECSIYLVGGIRWSIFDLFYNIDNAYVDSTLRHTAFLLTACSILLFIYIDNRGLFYTLQRENSLKGFPIKQFIVVFICVAVVLSGALLIGFYFHAFEFKIHNAVKFGFILILANALLSNLFVSIGEEVVYRGFLFNYLTKYLSGYKPALVISSLIFSLLHLHYQGILPFVCAFIVGLVIGYSYYRSRSLYIPIAIHFSWNFVLSVFTVEEVNSPLKGIAYAININQAGRIGTMVDVFEVIAISIILFILYRKYGRKGIAAVETRT